MNKLKREQFLPVSIDEAWGFFASPKNLNAVTPKDLLFEITSALPDQMYEGLIITYRIKPMLNISIGWCTEITHIKHNQYFIDEQRKGPYKIWHHEHHFNQVDGGVLMTDLLYYDIGKSIFGWLAGELFVNKKVKQIFDYRFTALDNYFQKKDENSSSNK